MPNASNRPKSGRAAKDLGGAATATNETPVSTADGSDSRATAQTVQPASTGFEPVPGASGGKATGRDHPSESEHPKPLEKRDGVTAKRVDPGMHHRGFTQTFDLRQKGARGPKPSQKSKGR